MLWLGLNFKGTVHQRAVSCNYMLIITVVGMMAYHAQFPFYVSSKGMGVAIDAARYYYCLCRDRCRVDADDKPVLRRIGIPPAMAGPTLFGCCGNMVTGQRNDVYVWWVLTYGSVQRYNLFNGGGIYFLQMGGWDLPGALPTLYSQYDIIKEAKEC